MHTHTHTLTPTTYSPIHSKKIEPCGKKHLELQRQKSGLFQEARPELEDNAKENERLEDERLKKEYDAKQMENNNSSDSDEDEDDEDELNLYDVLGIAHLGMNASPAQIKKAYQKKLLVLHPDKTGYTGEETDPRWLELQESYAILSDVARRRGFDSSFKFDNSIPTGLESGDFFEVYGPVFERNARFSTKKPVPLLGSMDSGDQDMKKFYNFWGKFDSWREVRVCVCVCVTSFDLF